MQPSRSGGRSGMSSFAAKLDALRRGLSEESSAVGTLAELKELLGAIPKQVDREKTAVYMFKELLNVYGELEDDRDRGLRDVLLEALEYLVGLCERAEDGIRSHFLVRTYNAMVKFNGKENNRQMILQCCDLVGKCPVMEDHMDLLARLCKVVLKVVWDLRTKESSALDFISSTSLRLVDHWGQSDAPEVRAKAIAIFHDVFGNATALLYRLFSLDEGRSVDFFRKLVQTFRSKGNYDERELIGLLQQSLPYLENILSLGDASKQYLQFTQFLDIFERINDAPTKKYLGVLRDYLKFQNAPAPDKKKLANLLASLKELSSCSDPLLVEIVVLITMQLRIHLDQLKQQAVAIARPTIDLCKVLMKFSKHCPRSHGQICARCSSSSRHLIDYISTMVIQLAMMLSKAADQEIDAELVALVNGFLKHKLLTLDDLSCERKQSLLDTALRFVVNWARIGFQLVDSREMLELTRMVIEFKYRYGFGFLTPIYMVRLLESCFKDCGSSAEIIGIKLIKLLLVMREDSGDKDPTKEMDEVIYSIMNHQVGGKDEKLRELNVVQLMERPDLDLYGFPISPTLNQQEKISILLLEMNWASRYKTSHLLDYFEQLRKLNADPGQLGMTLYLFQDNVTQISESAKESLKTKLQNARPKAAIDKIRRHGALAVLSYYEFSASSKAIVARTKDCQINKDALKNDQINDILRENTMEQEMIVLNQLEQTYLHFRDMIATLADTSFENFNLIYSLKLISSMLYNTSRFYQISYYPRRSVEMQLLNYVLVSQKPDRILDLCCPLGFLLEYNQIYRKLLEEPLYQKPWVPSLAQLAQKAAEIIASAESSVSKASESLKYNYMNLHLTLALYKASTQNLQASIAHLQDLNLLLQQHPDSTTVSIIRGRIYHVLFRLVTVHNLPPPRTISVRIFIRLMLEHYNEIQKLPTDYTFVVPTSTLEMTIDTLRYLVIRYDTDRIEAHVDQILRFVMRRGAGLRTMQILTLYAVLNVDGEKITKARMLLTFLDRLLMFRPISRLEPMKSSGELLAVPQVSLADTPNGSAADPTRKAVTYVKSPQKRSPSPNFFPEQSIDWQKYLVRHHTGCSCQFCRWPQYKCIALLTLAGYARLAFLGENQEQCHQFYGAMAKFWAQHGEKCFDEGVLLGQREEFLMLLGRGFMNYGQLLMKCGQVEQAKREFRKSLEMVRNAGERGDLGLVQDIEMNLLALEDASRFDQKAVKPDPLSYAEFIKQNAHLEPAPATKTNRYLMKTPKVGPSRVIPKTASRADDLLKQVARKRLKTTLAENNSQESVLISAMTGLSCGSERRPKNTVNVFVDSPEKVASGKLQTGKKKLFCKDIYSAEQETSPKKPTRGNIASETPAAAPIATRKKRLALSPTTTSFRDVLLGELDTLLDGPLPCSTPKVANTVSTRTTGRTTSKKPKPTIEYPKLGRTKSKSPKLQNQSFNSSFRDVLLNSLKKSAKLAADSSVIVLDDSDDIINTSITTENNSVNHSQGGVLSLKKYSDRKVYGSTRKKMPAKKRLQFDSSVVDITTPVSSPVTAVVTETAKVAKKTRGRQKTATTTTTTTAAEVTPEMGEKTGVATRTRTARKVRGKAGAV